MRQDFFKDYEKSIKLHQEWIGSKDCADGDWKDDIITAKELQSMTEFPEPMPWQKILEKHKTF